MITILHREGGVYRDPQKWLRNIWMTPNYTNILGNIWIKDSNFYIWINWACVAFVVDNVWSDTKTQGHMFYFCLMEYGKELDLVQLCETQKTSLNNRCFKIYHMLGLSGTLFCICAFDTWEYNFWYLWTILFSKKYHMLGLSGTLWYAVFLYLYLCICAFDTWEYNYWYPWTILF